jgi:isoleucyl-tRNA synthetase
MDYKDTLHLPLTEFPMRGNLGEKELEIQARWESLNIYQKNLLLNNDHSPFVLHDGPPYANGSIHIGHAMNKILKDFLIRYKTMKGFHTRYIPGWDTHGLPIETALAKKGIKRKDMPLHEYRNLCMAYALEQVEIQKVQFKRLGILGEWDQPYITLHQTYEADQIRVFSKMVEKGLIYKGLKPVYWSPSSETALAEAEIEYQEVEDTSIYVAFESLDTKGLYPDANFIIWTTTPWTLPANRAISVHPNEAYVYIQTSDKKYIVAEALLSKVASFHQFKDVVVLNTMKGIDLELMTYKHPLFDIVCPIICGEHVTMEDGSGLVHTAPGHGDEDYIVGKLYNLEVFCPVDEKGVMMASANQYEGLFFEDANSKIISDLELSGHLLSQTKFKHSYPHDWRTNKKVIFRATPQWFAGVKSIKDDLLHVTKDVLWTPDWGMQRLNNMIMNREDWCISRQRAWGVPIPVFYAENGDTILSQDVLSHVASLFETHGSNIWFEKDAIDLLPKGFKHPGSPNGLFKKETDIMDVWFDSGTSYTTLDRYGLSLPADVYLEGSDQYRGWFNSSLTTHVAVHGTAPYKQIVSHGFVLDGQGRKMSKSIGNTIDPLKVMNVMGADILRLWVATTDYQQDVRISDDALKQIGEGYRKIRNTIRYMLGVLSGYDPSKDYVAFSMRGMLNRAITIKLDDLINLSNEAYDTYAFDKIYRYVMPFVINDLSAFYLDFTKDILYTAKEKDFERMSVQSTIYDIVKTLLVILTPIMPHTMSEAYQFLVGEKLEDVYLERFPENRTRELRPKLLEALELLYELRDKVNMTLETARTEKVINKSMQASIDLTLLEKHHQAITYLQVDLKQIFMVAHVHINIGDDLKAEVSVFNGEACVRCWNVFETLEETKLCKKCTHVIKELI